jgi:hypothetical protein
MHKEDVVPLVVLRMMLFEATLVLFELAPVEMADIADVLLVVLFHGLFFTQGTERTDDDTKDHVHHEDVDEVEEEDGVEPSANEAIRQKA